MLDSLLEQLARLRGIGEAYYDYRGELKYFSPATRNAILAAMGCSVADADSLRLEIEELEGRHWRSLLPRVVVIRRGRPGVLLAVPADAMGASVQWRVRLEDGSQRQGTSPVAELTELERRDIDGRWLTRRLLVLPDDLPLGYHELSVVLGMDVPTTCALVVSTGQCFEPAALSGGARFWGLAVQLYTLRSQGNWGIGDFADLQVVVRECAAAGAAFVGLNPLHALFPANPGHFSPYSPSTRHFLNVFYIAVTQVAEFAECAAAREHVASPAFQAELARLRSTDRVDYQGVAAVKLPVLELLYRHFREHHLAKGTARAVAFREFQQQRGEPLRRHALHDAIDVHLRASGDYWGWPSWPEELRRPEAPGIAAFERANLERVEFFAWLQWLASEQLGEVQALARALRMPVGLYGDYAVGVNPSGSETWSDQDVYRMGAGVGAPPDPLALKGQDWGIPPQDPQALIAAQYRPFRNLIAANMRHFGALRLDHVMALFRQWWVPGGLGSTDGGYVHYPLEDLMSVLALESERNKCLVVGEDLGTVPDEMRHAMAGFAVYHYKVLLFEKEKGGVFRRPEHYVRRAIATVTTHDLPTLRGYWEGRDLALRDRLQLFPNEEIRRYVYDERVRDRAQLLAALESCGLRPANLSGAEGEYTEELARAVQLYLARSASALVVLQIEDLVGMTDPVNVPGTSDEHANWQRKVSVDLADVFSRPFTRQLFMDVNRARTS